MITSDAALEPLATDAGLNWQLAPFGSPTHVSVTVPLNPKVCLTPMSDVAEFPLIREEGDSAEAEIPKFGGVLLSMTAIPSAEGFKIFRGTMSGRRHRSCRNQ